MAASAVSIANRAIQALGSSESIESLTADSPNARTMNRLYEPRRQFLLRKYRWGFAIQRASVAADGSETLWGELKKYYLPNDYLRLLRDGDQPDYRKDWKIEGDATGPHVVSDESSPLEFRYIADVTDVGRMDSAFREVLALDMAWHGCNEVTGSTTKQEAIKELLDDALNTAKQSGAYESDPQEALEDDWIAAMR